MKAKNFPNRKHEKRLSAIERLEDALNKATKDSPKYHNLELAIANTESNISRHSDYRRTKVDRSARGKLRRD